MSEIKYNPPGFENTPEVQEIINEVVAEFGEKELDKLSVEELEKLYQSIEQESHIVNDVDQTRTPDKHRQDVNKRLNQIIFEIAKRKQDKINNEVKDLGEIA